MIPLIVGEEVMAMEAIEVEELNFVAAGVGCLLQDLPVSIVPP